ncbi:hypothetical protein GCM10009678_65940 [Actinomadura kijaniata]|uniref:Dihydrofolate synthase/folylpolyglutamate synthase n=1 Tax=Actinomadura namibiensis TaxID=182080 RepID=A0A7W3LYG1_ACTNM|nr:hypothetical protein [Actinomadura namibiensis]MBA8956497.1 dihydrofolate synthase/folylpolyglutamate synthase [Actinomadura namibiensis]
MASDEVFFREWRDRAPGERRDVGRARALAAALGLSREAGVPLLTVVGSKGKGTAATYASACLVAAGLRVCTVTSPGLRGDRDRVRVDGRAVADLGPLAERLARAVAGLPPRRAGYLSPSGLFLLAGVLHARDVGAGALVLEAGMGGRSDEVSLFAPTVVAVTPVFGEHLGVLGDSPAAIAAEKAAVAVPGTRAVVSAPQPPEIRAAVERTVGDVPVEYAEGGAVPAGLLPAGLGAVGAEVGVAAALRLLDAAGLPRPRPRRLRAVLGTVSLPGRLSWHRVPGAATEVLADSAIDRTGVGAALDAARERWGEIDHVLVCLPDHKDLAGAVERLGALPVTYVRLPYDHLRFTRPLPPHWRVLDAADLTAGLLAGLGRHVVALGTVYFVGLVLDLVGADTERLFDGVSEAAPPPGADGA